MLTAEQYSKVANDNLGRYDANNDSYENKGHGDEYVKCAECCKYIEVSEGESAHFIVTDIDSFHLCDNCFEFYKEELKFQASEQIEAQENIIKAAKHRISEINEQFLNNMAS